VPDEAESEGCGGSTVEDDNDEWHDLRRNPEGWGQFPSFLCHSSLEDSQYSSLLELKKLAPSAARGEVHNRL
jgi:hypothetical protein